MVTDRQGDRVQALAQHLAQPTGDTRAAVVLAHRDIAYAVADRHRARHGTGDLAQDDLRQVALIGVLKAADRFDAGRGVSFTTFAWAMAEGEVRQYVRDRRSAIRVPRPLQEIRTRVLATQAQLAAGGRPGHLGEVAEVLAIDVTDAAEALHSALVARPASLDADERLLDQARSGDEGMAEVEGRVWMTQLLRGLPRRDAEVVQLRFLEDLSQVEIARCLGMTQMQVSRVLRRVLDRLRATAQL